TLRASGAITWLVGESSNCGIGLKLVASPCSSGSSPSAPSSMAGTSAVCANESLLAALVIPGSRVSGSPDDGLFTATDLIQLTARLLRRHVRELAFEQPRARLLAQPAARRLGDAEVDQLDPALVGHEHVLRRHVAVHQAERFPVGRAARVRVVQARQRVGDDA